MTDITREQIINEARKTAERLGQDTLRREDFARETGISLHYVYSLFPEEGWLGVLELAGLRLPRQNIPISDEELLIEFHRVTKEMGRIPTWAIFADRANVARETISRRFHGMEGTLKAYRNWLLSNHPDSPVLEIVKTESRHEVPVPPNEESNDQTTASPQWDKISGPVFGPPIDFRGLRYAPTSEQGVVYLFGMVSSELGFIVEAIHSKFPDCEAKRRISDDRWQRVRIEFEYRSRNFLTHGHDPQGADLIVCWIHDWSECPLEVLELRKAIDKLEG